MVVSAEEPVPEKFHDRIVAVMANVVAEVQFPFTPKPREMPPACTVQMILLMQVEVPPDGHPKRDHMQDKQWPRHQPRGDGAQWHERQSVIPHDMPLRLDPFITGETIQPVIAMMTVKMLFINRRQSIRVAEPAMKDHLDKSSRIVGGDRNCDRTGYPRRRVHERWPSTTTARPDVSAKAAEVEKRKEHC